MQMQATNVKRRRRLAFHLARSVSSRKFREALIGIHRSSDLWAYDLVALGFLVELPQGLLDGVHRFVARLIVELVVAVAVGRRYVALRPEILLESLQDLPYAQLAAVRVLLGDGLHLCRFTFTVSSRDHLLALAERIADRVARFRRLVLLLDRPPLRGQRVSGVPQFAAFLEPQLLDSRLASVARSRDRMQKGLLIQLGHVYSRDVLVLELLLAEGFLPKGLQALPDVLVYVQVIELCLPLLLAALPRKELYKAAPLRLGCLVLELRSLLQERPGIIGVSVLIAAQLRLGRFHQETVGRVRFAILVRQISLFLPACQVTPLPVRQPWLLVLVVSPVALIKATRGTLGALHCSAFPRVLPGIIARDIAGL